MWTCFLNVQVSKSLCTGLELPWEPENPVSFLSPSKPGAEGFLGDRLEKQHSPHACREPIWVGCCVLVL